MTDIRTSFFNVPADDSTANVSMRDVVGNKDDDPLITNDDASILAYAKAGYLHAHGTPITYPTGEGGSPAYFVQATTGSTAYTHGAKVEIIPASAIAVAFDLHWLEIFEISASGGYEVKLWSGLSGAEVELGRYRYCRTTSQDRANSKAILIKQQAAGTRISLSIARDYDGAQTTKFAVEGHLYQ